jgi:hypothetical protein
MAARDALDMQRGRNPHSDLAVFFVADNLEFFGLAVDAVDEGDRGGREHGGPQRCVARPNRERQLHQRLISLADATAVGK